jgi:hypothetical protein
VLRQPSTAAAGSRLTRMTRSSSLKQVEKVAKAPGLSSFTRLLVRVCVNLRLNLRTGEKEGNDQQAYESGG